VKVVRDSPEQMTSLDTNVTTQPMLQRFELCLKPAFLGAFLPMLCWIETLALAWTCKSFLKYKRDFRKEFDNFLEEKKISPARMRSAMAVGMCITGSSLQQCMFGVRYPGSDIDTLEMGSVPRKERGVLSYNEYPRPQELKGHKLSSHDRSEEKKEVLSIHIMNPHFQHQSLSYISTGFEKLEYDMIVPVLCNKYVVVPLDSEARKDIIEKHHFESMRAAMEIMKQMNFGIIETICIDPRICSSPLDFVDTFCDISACKLIYDQDKLRIKHIDHLFTRSFVVSWDTKRYAWRTAELMVRTFDRQLEAKSGNKSAMHIARIRIKDRFLKYTARGLTCLNLPSKKKKKRVKKVEVKE